MRFSFSKKVFSLFFRGYISYKVKWILSRYMSKSQLPPPQLYLAQNIILVKWLQKIKVKLRFQMHIDIERSLFTNYVSQYDTYLLNHSRNFG